MNYRGRVGDKGYAHKPRVDVAAPGVPRSKVVLIVAVLILITVFIGIRLRVNADHKVDGSSVAQVAPVVATKEG